VLATVMVGRQHLGSKRFCGFCKITLSVVSNVRAPSLGQLIVEMKMKLMGVDTNRSYFQFTGLGLLFWS